MTKWHKWCGLSGKLHLKSSRKECSQQSRWCSHRPARGPSHGQQSRWATEWKLIQQSRTSSAGHRVNGCNRFQGQWARIGHMLITLTKRWTCSQRYRWTVVKTRWWLWHLSGATIQVPDFGTWATSRHNSQLLWWCTASLQLLEVFLIPFQRWPSFVGPKHHQYDKCFLEQSRLALSHGLSGSFASKGLEKSPFIIYLYHMYYTIIFFGTIVTVYLKFKLHILREFRFWYKTQVRTLSATWEQVCWQRSFWSKFRNEILICRCCAAAVFCCSRDIKRSFERSLDSCGPSKVEYVKCWKSQTSSRQLK